MSQQSRVYRNLNNGLWSIQQKLDGRMQVVAHAQHVELQHITIKQNDNMLAKIRATNCRKVCTMAQGELTAAQGVTQFKGRPLTITPIRACDASRARAQQARAVNGREATFNPHKDSSMVYRDNRGEQYKGGDYAVFTNDHKMMVTK